MLGKVVNFAAGLAWPAVRVIGSRPVMASFLTPAGTVSSVPRLSFDLQAEGKPRAWSADVASAIWRTFVEVMDVADDDGGTQVAAFVGRYGDPLGQLAAERATATADWFNLVAELAPLAGAWGALSAEGISRVERSADARAWLRFAGLKQLAPLVTLIPDPTGAPDLTPRVDSLAAYLRLSAVSALKREVPMRRCRTCSVWFELFRRDAIHCSTACRVIHHRGEAAALARFTDRVLDPAKHRAEQAELAAALERVFLKKKD
jgi:hypothetical protein